MSENNVVKGAVENPTESYLTELSTDFETRIANGGRVYLVEVYEKLGFETHYPEYNDARHAFWDKSGFHINDLGTLDTYTWHPSSDE